MSTLTTFDCPVHDLDARTNWEQWVARFRNYLLVANIPQIAPDQNNTNEAAVNTRLALIKANLLFNLGPTTLAIYNRTADPNDTFEQAITKITNAYAPQVESTPRVLSFREYKQLPGETIDQYAIRLREAARGCNFVDVDREIATQLIVSSRSAELRKSVELTVNNITVDDVLKIGRAVERYETRIREENAHLHAMTSQSSRQPSQPTSSRPQHSSFSRPQSSQQQHQTPRDNSRQYIPPSQPQYRPFQPQQQQQYRTQFSNQSSQARNSQICSSCGHQLPHIANQCPAINQFCYKCNNYGHFARCCRSRQPQHRQFNSYASSYHPHRVDALQSQDQATNNYSSVPSLPVSDAMNPVEDHEHCAALNTVKFGRRYTLGSIFGQDIEFLMDSGTTINLIDRKSYDRIKSLVGSLQPSFTNILPYNSNKPIETLGEFTANLELNNQCKQTRFIVTCGYSGSVLGLTTLESFGLVRFLNNITHQERFPGVFSERIGKIKNVQIKLHIDESIKPIQQHHRRIPFGLRDKVKAEIDRMLEMDIIEPITGPTPWVSPIVIVPKPGQVDKIRICVDAREANQAIQRERHITPTIDDIAHDLNGSCFFSKLDLTAGYHQLELHPDSRYITTFSTHVGLFRYKRLNFGINSASEIFQNIVHQLIADIPGTINFSDDILVHGPSREEHNRRLHAVLERLQAVGATINPFKSQFEKTELDFFGMTFSGRGISPDRKKVDAIKNTPAPKDAKEVRSFLGLTNYVSRFINDYSSISEPLWRLTRKDVPWNWTSIHDESIQKLKQALTTASMSYFDPSLLTEVIADASPVGLGAVLAQRDPSDPDNHKIISYASRLLTDTETRYSQIEKEALAVVWACERFHLYVIGREFDLVTDNKAVELILRNPRSSPPLRIQRWNLRLSQYKFNIKHRPGIDNPSDFLSRHPLSDPPLYSPADEYVNFIESQSSSTISHNELVTATNEDKELQLVKSIINEDKSRSEIPKSFKNIIDELTVSTNGLIFRHDRLVVPKSLQYQSVILAHEGHQGIERTKRLLRSRMWFAELDRVVQEVVESCHACQITTKARSPRFPIHLQPLPIRPWHTVSVDMYGPILNSIYLVHVQDEFSKFPFVKSVKSTSSEHIIPVLDDIFSVFGTPSILKSDNGPPFNGHQIDEFAKHLGFKHQKITPLWPRANGLNERFMQNITKIIVGARETGKKWQEELNNFLRAYRSTPHSSTGVTPAELMFKYRANTTRLPLVYNDSFKPDDSARYKAVETHSRLMRKVEERVNSRAVERNIKVGDQVLVQQNRTHKLMPMFDPTPYEVIEVKNTMITAARPNHVITRNISHFKVLKQHNKQVAESNRSAQHPVDPILLPYQVLLLTNQAAGVQTRPLPLMQLAVPPPPPPPPANAVVAAPNLAPVQLQQVQPPPPIQQTPPQSPQAQARPRRNSFIPIQRSPRIPRAPKPVERLNISNNHVKTY